MSDLKNWLDTTGAQRISIERHDDRTICFKQKGKEIHVYVLGDKWEYIGLIYPTGSAADRWVAAPYGFPTHLSWRTQRRAIDDLLETMT